MEVRCWLRIGALVLAALFVLNNLLRPPQLAALPLPNKTPKLPSSPDAQQLAASAQTQKLPNISDAQPLGAPAYSAPRDVTPLPTVLKPVSEGLTSVISTTMQKEVSAADALPRGTKSATPSPQSAFETEALAPTDRQELAPADGNIGWPPHNPRPASRYCRHYNDFENKVDFDAANQLVQASALAQNQTIVFAAGTNDARNLYAMIGTCKDKLGKRYRPDLLKIYGWEIGLINFERASRNLPKFPEVRISKHAISNVDGLVLNISGKDETSGIYPAGSRGIKGTTEQVTTRRYDTLALELNLSEVTFTEIDVEGHEVEAIYSMGLERHADMFPVFQYELGGTWTDARHTGNLNQTGTAEYLTRLGYRLYIMGAGGKLMPVDVKFFEKAKCHGHKEVGGNALAVLEAAGRSKPWLRKFIDDAVKKEKKLP